MTVSWFDPSTLASKWQSVPLRRLGRVLNGGTPTSDPANWGDKFPFVTPPDLNGADGALVKSTGRALSKLGTKGAGLAPGGSVLVSTRAPIGHVGRVSVVSAFNQGCRAIVPQEGIEQRFVAAALVAARAELISRGQGTTFLELSSAAFASIPIPLPPLDEQRAIADYLDRETAQIDALVAKQEEFVGLLRERRSRAREVLADRVTVGARLRWMLREIDHRAGSRAGDLPLFSVSIDWGVRRRNETTDKLSRAEDLSHYKVCLEGDIVVNRMRAFQGALGVAPADGIVSPDYAVLRAAPEADPSWLVELMRTKAFIGEITLRLRGIGGTDSGNVRTPRINTADLLDIRANVPDVTTQGMELTNLVAETTRIDALIAKTKEHIALAKERRSALITAAVTGQIDVRTARKAA